MKPSVLVVEDNKYMLDYFVETFKKDGRFALAGTLRDAEQTDAFCRINRVHLILMDVQTLHGHSGLSAAEAVRKSCPEIKIVVATSLVDAGVLGKARRVGVDSLWYKDHSPQELMDVVARTMDGEHIFPDCAPNVEIGSAWSDELPKCRRTSCGSISAAIPIPPSAASSLLRRSRSNTT